VWGCMICNISSEPSVSRSKAIPLQAWTDSGWDSHNF